MGFSQWLQWIAREVPMLRSVLILACAASLQAQDPFRPLDFGNPPPVATKAQAREDWVKITNQRMEMTGQGIRVAMEGNTAVVFAPGVEKPRHAKPILLGKGEHLALFKSIVALGFERIVVRNPDKGGEWGARLEKGKPILD
jgi:hypothetical protein